MPSDWAMSILGRIQSGTLVMLDLESAREVCLALDAAHLVGRTSAKAEVLAAPFRVVTSCPSCGKLHVDRGEWAERPHKTHLCVDDPYSAPERGCGTRWRLSEHPTVGVATLPDTTYLDDEPRGQDAAKAEAEAAYKAGQESMRVMCSADLKADADRYRGAAASSAKVSGDSWAARALDEAAARIGDRPILPLPAAEKTGDNK